MIKSSIFEVKVLGPAMRKLGQLPVYRGRGDAALVLKRRRAGAAGRRLRDLLPGGRPRPATRTCGRWWPRTGVARLALTTGRAGDPVAHWGAQEILPYGSRSSPHLFPRKTVRMVAGPPVDLSAYAGPAAVQRRYAARGHRRRSWRHHRPAGRASRGETRRPSRTTGDRPPQARAGFAWTERRTVPQPVHGSRTPRRRRPTSGLRSA